MAAPGTFTMSTDQESCLWSASPTRLRWCDKPSYDRTGFAKEPVHQENDSDARD